MKRDYLSHAFADAGCLELRHLDGHRITSGVFTERDAFSAAVSGRMPTPGVSERAARYSHSTRTRLFMRAYSLKWPASASEVER